MRVIYKWPLAITDYQEITAPIIEQVLTVQMQNGVPCLWAVVREPDVPPRSVPVAPRLGVFVVGTGNPIPDEAEDANYVGTIQQGPLVWHVFVKGLS